LNPYFTPALSSSSVSFGSPPAANAVAKGNGRRLVRLRTLERAGDVVRTDHDFDHLTIGELLF